MAQPVVRAAPADTPVRTGRVRWVPWLAAATAVLLLGLADAWWLVWSNPVHSQGGFGVSVHDVQVGRPYLVTVTTLCLDGPETAVVDDVTVERAGLTVTDFAVRPGPGLPSLGTGSGEEGSLTSVGFGDARSFSGQCDDEAYTELAVELSRNAFGPAHTETVDVHWSAGLRSGVVSIPVSITLCPIGDATAFCAELD